jgi:hypothetical protein
MLVARTGELWLQALRERSAATHRDFQALQRFFDPRAVFMHLGAGDCVLALQAAGFVERAYAVDPADAGLRMRRLPVNLRVQFSGAPGFGVEPGTVTVAFSETVQLARLADIRRTLAPRGVYLFHPRKAHTARRLREELLEAGFASVRFPSFFAVFPRRELVAAINP